MSRNFSVEFTPRADGEHDLRVMFVSEVHRSQQETDLIVTEEEHKTFQRVVSAVGAENQDVAKVTLARLIESGRDITKLSAADVSWLNEAWRAPRQHKYAADQVVPIIKEMEDRLPSFAVNEQRRRLGEHSYAFDYVDPEVQSIWKAAKGKDSSVKGYTAEQAAFLEARLQEALAAHDSGSVHFQENYPDFRPSGSVYVRADDPAKLRNALIRSGIHFEESVGWRGQDTAFQLYDTNLFDKLGITAEQLPKSNILPSREARVAEANRQMEAAAHSGAREATINVEKVGLTLWPAPGDPEPVGQTKLVVPATLEKLTIEGKLSAWSFPGLSLENPPKVLHVKGDMHIDPEQFQVLNSRTQVIVDGRLTLSGKMRENRKLSSYPHDLFDNIKVGGKDVLVLDFDILDYAGKYGYTSSHSSHSPHDRTLESWKYLFNQHGQGGVQEQLRAQAAKREADWEAQRRERAETEARRSSSKIGHAYTGETIQNTDGRRYAVIDPAQLDFDKLGAQYGKKTKETLVRIAKPGEEIVTIVSGIEESRVVAKGGEPIFINVLPGGKEDAFIPRDANGVANGQQILDERYEKTGGNLNRGGATYKPKGPPSQILHEVVQEPTVIKDAWGPGKHAFLDAGATLKTENGRVSGIAKAAFDETWSITDPNEHAKAATRGAPSKAHTATRAGAGAGVGLGIKSLTDRLRDGGSYDKAKQVGGEQLATESTAAMGDGASTLVGAGGLMKNASRVVTGLGAAAPLVAAGATYYEFKASTVAQDGRRGVGAITGFVGGMLSGMAAGGWAGSAAGPWGAAGGGLVGALTGGYFASDLGRSSSLGDQRQRDLDHEAQSRMDEDIAKLRKLEEKRAANPNSWAPEDKQFVITMADNMRQQAMRLQVLEIPETDIDGRYRQAFQLQQATQALHYLSGAPDDRNRQPQMPPTSAEVGGNFSRQLDSMLSQINSPKSEWKQLLDVDKNGQVSRAEVLSTLSKYGLEIHTLDADGKGFTYEKLIAAMKAVGVEKGQRAELAGAKTEDLIPRIIDDTHPNFRQMKGKGLERFKKAIEEKLPELEKLGISAAIGAEGKKLTVDAIMDTFKANGIRVSEVDRNKDGSISAEEIVSALQSRGIASQDRANGSGVINR